MIKYPLHGCEFHHAQFEACNPKRRRKNAIRRQLGLSGRQWRKYCRERRLKKRLAVSLPVV